MRTFGDRIRHAILFEVLLLSIFIPVCSYLLNKPHGQIGILGVVLSIIAIFFNYIFNAIFDRLLILLNHPVNKRPLTLRIFHSIAFEALLMIITIPVIMWWLRYPFWQALLLDLSLTLSVPLYGFCFNLLYDLIFPIPISEDSN